MSEIPKLMESYPQLIPNITKVFEPLKAYKWRNSHGERRREIIKKIIVILIMDISRKGLDEEELGRILQKNP